MKRTERESYAIIKNKNKKSATEYEKKCHLRRGKAKMERIKLCPFSDLFFVPFLSIQAALQSRETRPSQRFLLCFLSGPALRVFDPNAEEPRERSKYENDMSFRHHRIFYPCRDDVILFSTFMFTDFVIHRSELKLWRHSLWNRVGLSLRVQFEI